MHLLNVLLTLLVLSRVGNHALKVRSPSATPESLVTSFVERMHGEKPDCLLVIGHDYKVTPPAILNLLDNVAKNGGISVPVHWNESSPVPKKFTNSGPGDYEYYFSWLERPTARHLTNCGFFVMMYHDTHFEPLIKYMASIVRMDPRKDRFVYFSPDSDIRINMLHRDYNFLHQLGLVHDQTTGSINITNNCLYCDGGNPTVIDRGRYNLKEGMTPEDLEYYPEFARNFHGRHLNGSFSIGASPDEFDFMLANGLPVFPYLRVYLSVGRALNFDWHLDAAPEVPGQDSEKLMPDGNWTGMTGQMVHREVEISSAMSRADVFTVMDVPWPYYMSDPTFLRRTPRRLFSWYSIASPFTKDMWAAIFVTGMIASLVFLFILKVRSKLANCFDTAPPRSYVLYSFRYIFSALIEENPNLVPTADSLRVLIALWWIACDVLICGYEAKFFGFLVSPQMEVLPNNLKEMVEWPSWQWGALDWIKPYIDMFTVESEVEYHRYIKPKLINGGDMKNCLMKAINEDFSCIAVTELLVAMSMMQIDKEGTVPVEIASDSSLSIICGIAFSKYTPVGPIVGRIQMYIPEAGLYDKYLADFVHAFFVMGLKDARKANRLYSESMALNVRQMKGTFVLLCILLAASIVSFVGEVVQYRVKKSRVNFAHGEVDIDGSFYSAAQK